MAFQNRPVFLWFLVSTLSLTMVENAENNSLNSSLFLTNTHFHILNITFILMKC
jgi:hypothetical protein